MKLSKLLKKVSVAVSVLMMAGLLAACSSPSGGSSSSDNNNDGGAGTQQQNQNNGNGGNGSTNNGNGNNGGNGSGISDSTTPVTETPLVSASDVTVSATEIELSDGKWSYKEVSEFTQDIYNIKAIKEKEMTVSENGNTVEYTAMKKTEYVTIKSGATAEQIEAAKEMATAQGYKIDGNSFSLTKVYSDKELKEKSKYAISDFIPNSKKTFTNIKTNSDKTKYSWTITETSTAYLSEEDAKNEVNGVEMTEIIQATLVKISGSPATNNTSDDSNVEVTIPSDEYGLIYDGVVLEIIKKADADFYKTEFDEDDYTATGNTITLNSSGFASYLGMMSDEMSKGGKGTINLYAIVVYKNEVINYLTQQQYFDSANKLAMPADYTLKGGDRIIILTDAGWDKVKADYQIADGGETSNDPDISTDTSKTNTTSINDDTTYTVLYGYYGENHTGDEEDMNGKTFLEYVVDEYDLVEGKDYVITGTTIRVTALGLYKMDGDYYYDVMYNNDILFTTYADLIDNFPQMGFVEGTDYTVDEENCIVTILTKTAYDTISS